MTCPNLGVLCLLWSLAMTSFARSRPFHPHHHTPRVIPPIIERGPNYHEIFQDNSGFKDLICSATGTPPIEYRWLVNGKPLIPGEHTRVMADGSLIINKPTTDMEGYYQCLASNAAGVAMSNITFFQAAVFEGFPARQRTMIRYQPVSLWDHLVLPCDQVLIKPSIPSATITWHISTTGREEDFKSVTLSDTIAQAQDGSLIFSSVDMKDAALYKCIVRNNILQWEFGGSRVNVSIEPTWKTDKLKEPPVLLFSSSNVTLLEGDRLELMCLFGSWPVHSVEWRTPSSYPAFTADTTATMVIENVALLHSGLYECRARKMASLVSQAVNIFVQVDALPVFLLVPSNHVISRGHDVEFRCQGRSRPPPTVTWYINGSTLDQFEGLLDYSVKRDSDIEILVLERVRTTATVTCNISNIHGYSLQSAYVAFRSDDDKVLSTSSQNDASSSKMARPSTTQYTTNVTPSDTHYHPPITIQSRTTETSPKTTSGSSATPGNDQMSNPDGPTDGSEPPLSFMTIIIIIVVGVVLIIAFVAVVVCICVRRRRQSGKFTPGKTNENIENQQPLQGRRLPNEQAYDSDDSGLGLQ